MTAILITPIVIHAVEEMAISQGIKSLKLTESYGNIFPSDPLAGVGNEDNREIDSDDSRSDSEDSESDDTNASDEELESDSN